MSDQDRADEEGRVEPELETLLEEAEIEQLDLPGADRGIRREQGVQDVAGGDAAADASTGVQASQLHHTESGAMNLE